RNPSQIGEALAADIAKVSTDPVILYLDDVDRVNYEDEFAQWASAFVKALPAHVQLVISARVLSRNPWDTFIASGDAVVLGVETRRNNVIFTSEEPAKPQLECYALGRGAVLLNGKPI